LKINEDNLADPENAVTVKTNFESDDRRKSNPFSVKKIFSKKKKGKEDEVSNEKNDEEIEEWVDLK